MLGLFLLHKPLSIKNLPKVPVCLYMLQVYAILTFTLNTFILIA